jgi:hypothetical protein
LTICLPFSIYNALLNNRIFKKEIPVEIIWFPLLAAVSACVVNCSSESVDMTQTVGGATCASSSSSGSGGGDDESRSEGGSGSNGSQQQAPVPSSPSTRKSFFKKNVEDGMDRYVVLLETSGYRSQKSRGDGSFQLYK